MSQFIIGEGYPGKSNTTYVDWEKIGVGSGKMILTTDGISSCLAVTLYDRVNKIGSLAHLNGFDELKPDTVVDQMLAAMYEKQDFNPHNIEATLCGEGAFVAEYLLNSRKVRPILEEKKITIVGEDLERGFSRLAYLDCSNGNVEVYRIGLPY